MATRSFRPRQRRRPDATSSAAGESKLAGLVAEAKAARAARSQGYRERALALHGWICARCAREFEVENLHLLTVHHKDGNHDNNPPDGSNWENLCAYCHEAEHTTHTLGAYLTGRDRSGDRDR